MYLTLGNFNAIANYPGCWLVPDKKLSKIVAKVAKHWRCFSEEFRHNPYKSHPLWNFIQELVIEIIKDHGGEFISQGRIARDCDIMMSNRPEFGITGFVGDKKIPLFPLCDSFIEFSEIGFDVVLAEVYERLGEKESLISTGQKESLAKSFVKNEATLIWQPFMERGQFRVEWEQYLEQAAELYPIYPVYFAAPKSTKYPWLHGEV